MCTTEFVRMCALLHSWKCVHCCIHENVCTTAFIKMCALLHSWKFVHCCIHETVCTTAFMILCALLHSWECVHCCIHENVFTTAFVKMCALLQSWKCVHCCIHENMCTAAFPPEENFIFSYVFALCENRVSVFRSYLHHHANYIFSQPISQLCITGTVPFVLSSFYLLPSCFTLFRCRLKFIVNYVASTDSNNLEGRQGKFAALL